MPAPQVDWPIRRQDSGIPLGPSTGTTGPESLGLLLPRSVSRATLTGDADVTSGCHGGCPVKLTLKGLFGFMMLEPVVSKSLELATVRLLVRNLGWEAEKQEGACNRDRIHGVVSLYNNALVASNFGKCEFMHIHETFTQVCGSHVHSATVSASSTNSMAITGQCEFQRDKLCSNDSPLSPFSLGDLFLFTFVLIKMIFIYLIHWQCRDTHREKQTSRKRCSVYLPVHSLAVPITARVGPGQSQEPETQPMLLM